MDIQTQDKVHIFCKGHKILRDLHLTFDWHYIGQKQGEDSQNIWNLPILEPSMTSKMLNDCPRNNKNSPKICTIFSFSSWNLSSVLTSMSRVFLRKDSTSLSFSCKISLSLLTSPSQLATLSLFSNSSLKASKKDHSYITEAHFFGTFHFLIFESFFEPTYSWDKLIP